jgi:hypothetical protein
VRLSTATPINILPPTSINGSKIARNISMVLKIK